MKNDHKQHPSLDHEQHQHPPQTQGHVGHAESGQKLASAPHPQDKHAGHSPEIFKQRFFICLLLTLPVLYFSPDIQGWFNYQAVQIPGANLISPALSTIIYFYGGWVFLVGAWREFHSRIAMMTLIALAIRFQ